MKRRQKEELRLELAFARSDFLNDLELLRDYNNFVNTRLKRVRCFDSESVYQKSSTRAKSKTETTRDKVGLINKLSKTSKRFLEATGRPDDFKLKIRGEIDGKGEILFATVDVLDIPKKYRDFLNQLTLVHALTLLESFIKTYISRIFKKNTTFLISDKKLAVAQLVKLQSKSQLLDLLVENEILSIGYKSLDKLNIYLISHFNIDLQRTFPHYAKLKEITHIRNLCVHDYPMEYSTRKKTLPAAKSVAQIDDNYIRESIEVVSSFIDHFHISFSEKLKLPKVQ
jgi:hypothetical protein